MKAPHGHGHCSRCERLWESKALTTVPTGNHIWWRVDARRLSSGGARIGWPDETKRVGRPEEERVCPTCLAKPDPRDQGQLPIAKRAAAAWADASPEVRRLMPKHLR